MKSKQYNIEKLFKPNETSQIKIIEIESENMRSQRS